MSRDKITGSISTELQIEIGTTCVVNIFRQWIIKIISQTQIISTAITEYDGFKFKDYYFDIESERILKITRSKIKIIKPRYHNKMLVISLYDIYQTCYNRSYQKLIRTFKKVCDN